METATQHKQIWKSKRVAKPKPKESCINKVKRVFGKGQIEDKTDEDVKIRVKSFGGEDNFMIQGKSYFQKELVSLQNFRNLMSEIKSNMGLIGTFGKDKINISTKVEVSEADRALSGNEVELDKFKLL